MLNKGKTIKEKLKGVFSNKNIIIVSISIILFIFFYTIFNRLLEPVKLVENKTSYNSRVRFNSYNPDELSFC